MEIGVVIAIASVMVGSIAYEARKKAKKRKNKEVMKNE